MTEARGQEGEVHPYGTRSAGGVIVVRATDAGPRVAVLEAGGLVSLPRAEVGPGESAETAARRAGQVFLGFGVRLVETVGETMDELDGDQVVTWYWLARIRRGSGLEPKSPPPLGFTVHWLDVEEAADELDSDEERELVRLVATERSLPRARRWYVSAERRAVRDDIESLRDATVADAHAADDPGRLDALVRTRVELELAESRFARGDLVGARRAHARAERESLGALDVAGRRVALERGLARLSDGARAMIGVEVPENGAAVALEELLAVQLAVEMEAEQRERRQARRKAAQVNAAVALIAVSVGVIVGSQVGVFRPRGSVDWSPGAEVLAAVFVVAGALGGWAGEAVRALRGERVVAWLEVVVAAAAGAVCGVVVGAVLTNGLSEIVAGTSSSVCVVAAFVGGWIAGGVVRGEG